MKKQILGLDTGTNSLGWAVVDRDEYDNYTLVKHGGLIFQEGVKIENDVRAYAESDVFYPKRYKIRSHVYFIVIKTMAQTMLDFKQKKAVHSSLSKQMADKNNMGDMVINRLNEIRLGWYEGELDFKRVVVIPSTGKHEYRDTKFVAQCKAESGIECYSRIVDYLRTRVDNRSQFPSAKGKNFRFKYLGLWK